MKGAIPGVRKLTIRGSDPLPVEQYFSFPIRPYLAAYRFRSNETLIREAEQPDCLYFIAEGRVKISLLHENGRETIFSFLSAPAFVGELELLGERDLAAKVTTLTPCTCYRIQSSACRGQILNDSKFLRELCLMIARRNIQNTRNFAANQSYPLNVRLAQFILLSSHNGLYREKHTEAAAYLGVTYRHFLYVLADFVKQGLLEKTERGYRIANEQALRRAAGNNDY